MGDHNIDISEKRWDNNNFLSDLCDTFSLQTVAIWKTCLKSNIGTSIDNSPIHRTGIFAARIRNHHKLIPPFFRSYYTRISPKTIEYKKYKTFNKYKFLYDLDQELLKSAIYQNNEEIYSIFTRIFQNVLNKHAPLK